MLVTVRRVDRVSVLCVRGQARLSVLQNEQERACLRARACACVQQNLRTYEPHIYGHISDRATSQCRHRCTFQNYFLAVTMNLFHQCGHPANRVILVTPFHQKGHVSSVRHSLPAIFDLHPLASLLRPLARKLGRFPLDTQMAYRPVTCAELSDRMRATVAEIRGQIGMN